MGRSSLSFSRARCLKRASEFERVRQQGRSERGKTLVLGVLSEGGTGDFRAGFITSRRIGRAVVRNRVRRRLREIVRRNQHEIGAGVWVVTIARAAAAHATYRQLEDEWLRLAKRASILAA
ncbi:MAG: ribonuclease P protein component [Chthoniobacterales bacterium]